MFKWFAFSGFVLAQVLWSFFLRHFSWLAIESVLFAIPFQCPLNQWFHIQCAFCGITHAVIAFYRGEWALALHHNALVFVLVGFMNLFGLAYVTGLFAKVKISFEQRRVLLIVGIVGMLVFAVVRQL